MFAFASQLAHPPFAHADGLADAERAYAAGQYKQAQTLIMNVVEKSPNQAVPQYMLGNIDFQLGDQNGARAHYDQAVKLEPSSDAAAMSLAMIHKLNTMPKLPVAIPGSSSPPVSNYSKANFFSSGASSTSSDALAQQERLPNGSFGTVFHGFDGSVKYPGLELWGGFSPGALDKEAFSPAASRPELEAEMMSVLQSLRTRETQDILSIEKQKKLAYDPSRSYEYEEQKIQEMVLGIETRVRKFYAGRESGEPPPEKISNIIARLNTRTGSGSANSTTAQINQVQPNKNLAPFGNNRTTKNYMVTPGSENAQIELKAAAKSFSAPSTENVKK